MNHFQDYQKLEYERVAEAHFKTIDAISSFFRYYLIVMSLPATAVAFFLSTEKKDTGHLVFLDLSSQVEPLLGFALIIIAGVGLFLLLYVMNLRMDGILYARTVNAIRKYFYDESNLDLVSRQQLRVLPQSQYQPPYFEGRYFLPVVFTFVFLDTAYFFAGISLWNHSWIDQYLPPLAILSIGCFVILHHLFYCSYARHREHGYLTTSAIGIDIDGVLNKHREKFCEIFEQKTGRSIKPEQIQRLPVRDNKGLGVNEDEEMAVFHDPSYWTKMDVVNGAQQNLRRLRNELNLKIHVFSYRPWPVPVETGANNYNFDAAAWLRALLQIRKETKMSAKSQNRENPEGGLVSLFSFFTSLPRSIKDWFLAVSRSVFVRLPWVHKIDRITHLWLYKHKLEYDRLIIEKGHSNLASPNARFVNRFNMARRHNLRFFIEDDLEKAVKMANICDVVFLVDHPYNRQWSGLPANIRRVSTWDEIYSEVRKLS